MDILSQISTVGGGGGGPEEIDEDCLVAFVERDHGLEEEADEALQRDGGGSAALYDGGGVSAGTWGGLSGDVLIDIVVGTAPPVSGVYDGVSVQGDDVNRASRNTSVAAPAEITVARQPRSSKPSKSMAEAKAKARSAKQASSEPVAARVWVLSKNRVPGFYETQHDQQVHPGQIRLAPITDVRLEPDSVSTALVAAGYVLAGSLGNERHLWYRRATTATEARDLAVTRLRFTAGRMDDMSDPLHSAPIDLPASRSSVGRSGRTDGGSKRRLPSRQQKGQGRWSEVMGRQQRSMPLTRTDPLADADAMPPPSLFRAKAKPPVQDVKLWMERGGGGAGGGNGSGFGGGGTSPSYQLAQLEHRVALALSVWDAPTKARAIEASVRRSLRQPQMKSAQDSLDSTPDLNQLVNSFAEEQDDRRTAFVSRTSWRRVLQSNGLMMHRQDSEWLMRRIADRCVACATSLAKY